MKKKKDFGLITYPLVAFLIFIVVPWGPTLNVLFAKSNLLWLVLTIGWAICWYMGIFVWNDTKNEETK